jgi:hypothetical protein
MKMKLDKLLIMSRKKKIGTTSCFKNPKKLSKDWIGWVLKIK